MPHVEVTRPDGHIIRLFCREGGQGDAILWIQGLSIDHRGWAAQIPAFSPLFRCITFDNRDVGQSDLTPEHYDIGDMAADAVALLDALGVAKAHVVGASMGGAIAQEIAITKPERVGKLVLIATYTSGDPRGSAIFQGQALLRKHFDPETYCRLTFPLVYTHRDYRREGFIEETIAAVKANPHPQPQEAYERQVQATTTYFSEGRLGAIQAPTLILVGDEDILTPMRFALALEREIKDSRLVVVPGAGHGIIWTDAERVNREILAFLRG